jgi:outer membrane protein
MIKKLTLAAFLTSGILYADTIGGEISLGIYSHAPSGSASYTLPGTPLNSPVDLENDLRWSNDQDIILKAYFENPLPFFPNIKLAYSNFNHSGEGTVNSFSWGSIIGMDGIINTSLETKEYDITAYYELLDNVVEIDAGLTFKYINGDILVTPIAVFNAPVPFSPSATLPSQSTELDLWIPMLYGKARFNIPNTDISLQFEGNAINYEETTFYDYTLSARYAFFMELGLEAGYKSMHLDSKDLAEGLAVDMDFSGLYAAIVWDF